MSKDYQHPWEEEEEDESMTWVGYAVVALVAGCFWIIDATHNALVKYVGVQLLLSGGLWIFLGYDPWLTLSVNGVIATGSYYVYKTSLPSMHREMAMAMSLMVTAGALVTLTVAFYTAR
jgi:hypothetical protein